MASQNGYLKLLITQSILSGHLDFEIKRVACTQQVLNYHIIKLLQLYSTQALNYHKTASLKYSNNTVTLKNSTSTQLLVSYLISSQSLNLGGHRGTIDDFATILFHPSLSSAALRESPNSIPVHSLMLSSHLFFCHPLLLAPFTVLCWIVFAMSQDLEMWPYHLSLWLGDHHTLQLHSGFCCETSSFVTWSL